jgi:hypothetical protein
MLSWELEISEKLQKKSFRKGLKVIRLSMSDLKHQELLVKEDW